MFVDVPMFSHEIRGFQLFHVALFLQVDRLMQEMTNAWTPGV
jgi:hypothetical protein